MSEQLPDDVPVEPGSVADRIGVSTFRDIVDDFYDRVEEDELLRPIYPDELEPGKTHLAQFLAQYFGATGLYSSRHGHPRLRMRHNSFRVTVEAAARWAALMSDAIVAQDLDEESEAALLAYVAQATPQMVNTFPDHGTELPTSH